jgi:hypothetical protein
MANPVNCRLLGHLTTNLSNTLAVFAMKAFSIIGGFHDHNLYDVLAEKHSTMLALYKSIIPPPYRDPIFLPFGASC